MASTTGVTVSGTTLTITNYSYLPSTTIWARFIPTNAAIAHSQVGVGSAHSETGGTANLKAYIYETTYGKINPTQQSKTCTSCATINYILYKNDTNATAAQKKVILKATAKSGYTFVGWFNSASDKDVRLSDAEKEYATYDEFKTAFSTGAAWARFVKTQVENFIPWTRCISTACEDTSITTFFTPAFFILLKQE
jgi:uncharacterized repeat protein (TIGR02543 family)